VVELIAMKSNRLGSWALVFQKQILVPSGDHANPSENLPSEASMVSLEPSEFIVKRELFFRKAILEPLGDASGNNLSPKPVSGTNPVPSRLIEKNCEKLLNRILELLNQLGLLINVRLDETGTVIKPDPSVLITFRLPPEAIKAIFVPSGENETSRTSRKLSGNQIER